jgi:hypothetical protein
MHPWGHGFCSSQALPSQEHPLHSGSSQEDSVKLGLSVKTLDPSTKEEKYGNNDLAGFKLSKNALEFLTEFSGPLKILVIGLSFYSIVVDVAVSYSVAGTHVSKFIT